VVKEIEEKVESVLEKNQSSSNGKNFQIGLSNSLLQKLFQTQNQSQSFENNSKFNSTFIKEETKLENPSHFIFTPLTAKVKPNFQSLHSLQNFNQKCPSISTINTNFQTQNDSNSFKSTFMNSNDSHISTVQDNISFKV
jgi:hypothetical protein